MTAALIAARGIRKAFGRVQVLHDVTLLVRPGDVVAIIGPSGSGKSTLIRCLNGLVRPDGGELAIEGRPVDLRHEGAWQRLRVEIGMVFQDYALFPHLDVLGNITLAPVLRGRLDRRAAEAEARHLLDRVGLADKAGAYPSELSGGQQQRVAIVRALAMRPRAILFDEPTSALDPETITSVLAVMRGLADEGMTMVVVTHEMGFAREVADEIVFMADGRIVEQAPPSQLFGAPRQERTRTFLRDVSTYGAPTHVG